MKNGEIILCNNIKLDKNYENVLSYSESNMVNLCRQHAIYTGTKYTMMDPSTNEIDIRCPYATCIYSNYIAFNNKNVGNKWYFAFVTDIIYVNPEVTKIRYQVDVFSTWYQRFNLNQAFIEREHVDDDTVGKHILPESVQYGDYVVSDYVERGIFANGNRGYIIIGLSNLVENFPVPTQNVYNGIFSGLTYYILEDATKATQFIQTLMEAWGYDADRSIYCLFMVPREMINPNDIEWKTGTISGNTLSFGILPSGLDFYNFGRYNLTHGTSINQYVPKNNKLLTSPYNYCLATNNVGETAEYKFEDFLDGNAHFDIKGCITVGCSIRMDPALYKNGFYNEDDPETIIDNRRFYSYGLSCGKYPTCSWNSDAYTNWLTTNAVNMVTETAAKIALSAGGFMSGNVALGVSSALDAVTSAMSYGNNEEQMPDQARGNTNTGDILFSMSALGFSLYRMTIKADQAKIIDEYFSRYGYKVNEVKTPNLNSRSKFNFIKVGGMDELVTGSIPASDLETINSIFRKGVTIFHNYNDIGNYLIDNPIVE